MEKRLTGKFVVAGLHPAIDRTIEVPALRRGGAIRGKLLLVQTGGKGTNVARSLAHLGNAVTIRGILAENDAPFFRSALRESPIRSRFVTIPGDTRQNITIVEAHGVDTHVISGRMRVSRNEARRVRAAVADAAERGDWAIVTGSRPEGFTLADYEKTLRVLRRKGARPVVDADGKTLAAAMRNEPWLIKPNRAELERLLGRRHRSTKRLVGAARDLLDACAIVLLSLDAEGAALIARDGSWRSRDTAPVRVVHTVGCGDALLAGFLSAYAAGKSPAQALRFGVACGSACVRTRSNVVRSTAEVRRRLPGVVVERI